MYATTFLEWWHDGAWRRIGWLGSDPKRTEDLRAHGQSLASSGGHYRLVTDSPLADAPPIVLERFDERGLPRGLGGVR